MNCYNILLEGGPSFLTTNRPTNSTGARLGWTFSYIYCIFVHPDLDLALLFVGMRERSIGHEFAAMEGF